MPFAAPASSQKTMQNCEHLPEKKHVDHRKQTRKTATKMRGKVTKRKKRRRKIQQYADKENHLHMIVKWLYCIDKEKRGSNEIG